MPKLLITFRLTFIAIVNFWIKKVFLSQIVLILNKDQRASIINSVLEKKKILTPIVYQKKRQLNKKFKIGLFHKRREENNWHSQ